MAETTTGYWGNEFYWHDEDDKFILEIPSHEHDENTDEPKTRAFTVIFAKAVGKNGYRRNDLNGVVIIDAGYDDGNGETPSNVILESHANGNPERARQDFEDLKRADWFGLVKFLLESDAYGHYGILDEIANERGGPQTEAALRELLKSGELTRETLVNEIGTDGPAPTPFKTLLRIGAATYGDEADMRTEEMKAMDANPEAPYRIPAIGHEEFVAELVKRGQCYGSERTNASAYLGWFCHLELPEDLSGKTGGYADEISDEFDEHWDVHVEAVGRAELEEQLVNEFFDEFCQREEYSTYFGDDQGSYKFYSNGEGELLLAEINGESLAFSPSGGIEEAYARLSDESRKMLLNVVRSLDHDLTKPKLAADMEHRLNFLRYTKEEEWQAKRDQKATPGNLF
jgi:hypothetical protein